VSPKILSKVGQPNSCHKTSTETQTNIIAVINKVNTTIY
jgi:hypothetical protein